MQAFFGKLDCLATRCMCNTFMLLVSVLSDNRFALYPKNPVILWYQKYLHKSMKKQSPMFTRVLQSRLVGVLIYIIAQSVL